MTTETADSKHMLCGNSGAEFGLFRTNALRGRAPLIQRLPPQAVTWTPRRGQRMARAEK